MRAIAVGVEPVEIVDCHRGLGLNLRVRRLTLRDERRAGLQVLLVVRRFDLRVAGSHGCERLSVGRYRDPIIAAALRPDRDRRRVD
jgi:hypothetical protein